MSNLTRGWASLIVVGLTGGIATGKSTVVEMFRNLGAVIIDSDIIAREVVKPGTAGLAAIVDEFGPGILTAFGELDRKKLAGIVFTNEEARRRLNSIVHPLVRDRIVSGLSELRRKGTSTPVIVDVPLLYESGFDELVDTTLVVYAPEEVQLQRLVKRDNLPKEEARARIAAQLPISEKVRRADYVIDNSDRLDSTFRQVRMLWERWVHEDRFDCARSTET